MAQSNVRRAASQRLPRVTFEDFLALCEGVRRHGDDRAEALCKAHGDRQQSLGIRRGDDGRVLLICRAGCAFEDICAAFGVEPSQLFPEPDRPWKPTRLRRDPEADLRADFAAFKALHTPPPPTRMEEEFIFIGRLILGGATAFRQLPTWLGASQIQTPGLRLPFEVMKQLVKQGTPWGSFPPNALGAELDRTCGAGSAASTGLVELARAAVRAARKAGRRR